MKTILVTGGAGYIGSATVKALVKNHNVIVVDNLSKGLKKLVDKKAKFYKVDLVNKKELEQVFKKYKIDAVMHFAAYKAVEESMKNPIKYNDNITGTINLLDMMVKYNVKKLIFSSTAAVYGLPKESTATELTATEPINYYGFAKLECERIINWYSKIYGINYISLRYFNVAGDSGLNYIDPEAENILPIIMEVIFKKRKKLTIFGNDYNTRDGTCIRDYININDLVKAHILALNTNYDGIINLGTSKGVTVKELVDYAMEVTKIKFKYEFGPRRKGDPPALIASNEKAKRILKWKPNKDAKQMIKSTYNAYRKN